MNDQWLWIARECRRAGTVEILQGVNLEALFALRKARNLTYGYDPEKNKSKYHLCHISPAVGDSTVGLLHHLNLFIGGSFYNQVHGNNSYHDRGLSIPTSKLKKKWLVDGSNKDSTVLEKMEKYLGQVLLDYAEENPINTSGRIGLARWIYKNDPSNKLTIKKLEEKGVTELREIKAKAQDKELYQHDYTARRSFVVMLEECFRLAEQLPDGKHRSDVAFMILVLQVGAAWLSRVPGQDGLSNILANPYGVKWIPLRLREGMEETTLRNFIGFQAFQALQGATVDRKMIRATLSKYLEVMTLTPDHSASNRGMQEHFATECSQFIPQVPVIKNAIIRLGLPDKIMLAEEIAKAEVAAYEESVFASFQYEQCDDPDDYSTIYYQVEEDYIPSPNLKVYQREIFCPF
ncbi:hypothetical protein [Pseudomonas sp. 43NM1]|uniref:hypothetical protein n=1 Tax=Pseudomonas sp. 43NM1 TaxID=1904755 RepID=UPI0012FF4D2F|nr:hypothetical protein [Pseudomonas sp. 43NM1]